ncbi:MAG: insulinase family protein [Bacteroidales bacterium]|nr:insulinase family protein [Bacteroidales bacterium]
MKSFKLIFLFLWVALLQVGAQTDLQQPIPIDPAVRIGKLDNGLTYYIRHNSLPTNRVEMRLVVNAGSILEDDDQQGLAHFVEHMSFNGTKNFSKSALVDFLERAGVRFGADLNAYTSFDETVYMLQMPTDRPGLVDSGFMVLEDWSHAVAMEGEEIDKERGVIREEWRLGLGADDRMRKTTFPIMLNGSRYAERLPIGMIGVIDTASYETLRRFYHEWYRPNLQAIVVTGDLDVDAVENTIKERFGDIENPKNARDRMTYTISDNKEPLVAITTDAEATNTSLTLYYKHPRKELITYNDFKHRLMQFLYSSMIIERLQELNQKPESPFIYAYTYYGGFIGRAVDAYTSSAVVKQNQIEKAVETLVVENQRVKQHGFTSTELERQKIQFMANLERRQKEKDKTPSSSFVREYTSHFLSNSPIPGIDNEVEMTKMLMPLITLEDMNNLATQWITDENRVIVVTAPDKEEVIVPDKATILSVIENAQKIAVEPYIDATNEEPLLSKTLEPVKIIEKTQDDNLGIHTFSLENGIKVIIKPTDFKNDEILLTSWQLGGTSLFEDTDAYAATNISRIADASGLGAFSAIELGKKLAGQNVNVNATIEELRHGLRGNASPKDFETLLQLVYLHYTPARVDENAFEAYKSQLLNRFKFMRSNPQMIFTDTLVKIISSNSPRSVMLPSEENFASLEAEKIASMYDQLYGNAAGSTFIFTGNLDPEASEALIAKYLGNLPVSKSRQWVDRKIKFPEGITDAKVYAGTEYKSLVGVFFKDNFVYDSENILKFDLLAKAYNIKLRENMREEIGGVYGVGARLSFSQFPQPEYTLTINWGTNPELVDTLTTVVFAQMELLMADGPSDEDLAKVKETAIRQRESDDRLNYFWNSYMDNASFNQTKMVDYATYRQQIESVTIEDLKLIAQKYFNPNHFVKVTLYPEQKE